MSAEIAKQHFKSPCEPFVVIAATLTFIRMVKPQTCSLKLGRVVRSFTILLHIKAAVISGEACETLSEILPISAVSTVLYWMHAKGIPKFSNSLPVFVLVFHEVLSILHHCKV